MGAAQTQHGQRLLKVAAGRVEVWATENAARLRWLAIKRRFIQRLPNPGARSEREKIIRLARIVSSNHLLCFRNYRAFIPKFTALNSGIYGTIQP